MRSCHVVVEHRARRDQRLVAEAERVGVELGVRRRGHLYAGSGNVDACAAPSRRSVTRKLRQAVRRARAATSVSREQLDALQHHVGAVRHQLAASSPGAGRRSGAVTRRKFAAAIVGADVEAVAAVIDVVLVLVRARRDQRPRRRRAGRAARKRTSVVVWLRDWSKQVAAGCACAPRRRGSARPSPRSTSSSCRPRRARAGRAGTAAWPSSSTV